MDLIRDLRGTNCNLMKHVFEALLTVPNSNFVQCFEKKMLSWETSKPQKYDKLPRIAAAVRSNMVGSSTWGVVEAKYSVLLALHTEVNGSTASLC